MCRTLRCAITDVEDDDISTHFAVAYAFIAGAAAAGGAVLVHCHEGKSRSVALVLAYLMRAKVIIGLAPQGSCHPECSAHLGADMQPDEESEAQAGRMQPVFMGLPSS